MTSLLRPAKISSPWALRVARSPVASQPGSRACKPPCCHTWAAIESPAHQDLAIGSDLHLPAGERFADAAAGDLERMVQRHQRRGLGHPVTLDQGKADRGPEALQVRRQGSSSRDESPEFKTQAAMHGAEAPPPFPDRLAPGGGQTLRKPRKLRLQPASQQIEHPRNRRQNRDPLLVHEPGQARRLQAVFKVDLRCQQRRNPQPHELAKDVAERQRMQNAQRMNQALVAQVLGHLLFQGIERGQHIAVGMHDALRLPGSAGGEDDLQRRIPREAGQGNVVGRREPGGKTGKAERGNARAKLLQQRQVPSQQPGLHLGHHPPRQLQAACGIQRHCNDSAQNASKESRYPLHRVVSPKQNTVAGTQAELVKGMSATGAQLRQLGVGGRKTAIAAVGNDRDLLFITAEVRHQRCQVRSHPFSVA